MQAFRMLSMFEIDPTANDTPGHVHPLVAAKPFRVILEVILCTL
jgi:hypothetical protein